MIKKDFAEYQRNYNMFRHHAWAGLGFLSVVLAIRLILLEYAFYINIIVIILVFYILISLIFSYKYRSGLLMKEQKRHIIISENREIINSNSNNRKDLYKLEKKKRKLELKKIKKDNK